MLATYACQRCSQLPPPPPLFSIGPPPNILSVDIRCSSRSLSSPSTEHQKFTYSSSSSLSLSISLGVVMTLLIMTSVVLLFKNRMIKRRQERQKRYAQSSSSDKFNAHNHHHHHRHHWTKLSPLLSDSCSSDQTLSTPSSDYPCAVIEPLLSSDLPHEYEQIKYDNAVSSYCLIYCRQCANYHHTNVIPSSYAHQCTCHLREEKHHLFELQPMLRTMTYDDANQQQLPSV